MASVGDIKAPQIYRLSDGTPDLFREAFKKNGISVPDDAEFEEHILAMFRLCEHHRCLQGLDLTVNFRPLAQE
jgi:hypothetical protein